MRNIAISTEVFSLIWAQRRPPEETENEILLRILTSMRPLSDEAAGANQLSHSIYREVECIRREAGRSIPKTLEAVIRRTLEDHSSDSANYRGVDLFGLPEGHGKGIWALRK